MADTAAIMASSRRQILESMECMLKRRRPGLDVPVAPVVRPRVSGAQTILGSVDLTRRLEPSEYASELRRYQGSLNRLSRSGRRSVAGVAVFEG